MSQFNHDDVIKVVVAGDSGCGKTSIMNRYCLHQYQEEHYPTIGIEMQLTQFQYENQLVKMQIWDTSGGDRFQSITNLYFRNIDAIVLVFSFDNYDSFSHLTNWMQRVRQVNSGSDQLAYIVVGHKNDLKLTEITSDDIQTLLQTPEFTDVYYLESSAKNNTHIDAIFIQIAKHHLNLISKHDQPQMVDDIPTGCCHCFKLFGKHHTHTKIASKN